MKLRSIILLTAIAGLAMVSCKVTDLSPRDSFTDESYWNTVQDLELYANGLYGLLPGPDAYGDEESDNFVTNTHSSYLFGESTVPASSSSSNGWYWTDIRKCNYFMARYEKVGIDDTNEAEVYKYVGEVRFFRALLYFDKIKMFGDVPWYDKDLQTTDTEELYKARDPRDYVLGKIIEDLEFAIEWLPEKAESISGRINKDAARALMARICLYYGTFMKYHNETPTTDLTSDSLLQKAADISQTIMDSGNYSIVQGSDAGCDQQAMEGYPLYYSNQFTQYDLSGNAENILCLFYEEDVLTHNVGRTCQQNGMGLSKDFVESFLMKDGTPIYNEGSGYQGDEDQDHEFADRDPRIYQVIDNHNKYYYTTPLTINTVADCTGSGNVTGYPCVKYHAANTEQQEANNSYYDWFCFRYAEVLLINAEANAELGTCTQTTLDNTINLLRDRVEMAHLTVNPVDDAKPIDYGYDISNLLYEIRRERRIELVNEEDKRMDDIKRWNAAKLLQNPKTMFGLKITDSVRQAYGDALNITFDNEGGRPVTEYDGDTYLYPYQNQYTSLEEAIGKRTWDEYPNDIRWLYPIPTEDLTLNPNLTQNPGWN
ncbi:MAG: RagB/SusD family nutrient uptake outer membrane protein [Bacteroidales bacterium]|nr:RagB/SusD family nutrient uptake outer membrane protein [Bacteroidales bacterium]